MWLQSNKERLLFLVSIKQDPRMEKKSSDLYVPDDVNYSGGVKSGRNVSASDPNFDEEAPLMTSSRISHLGRNQLSNHPA